MRRRQLLPLAAAVSAAAITATPAHAKSGAFQSPSGNIGCYIMTLTARCDIRTRDWEPPPRPASCEFDYGQGIAVNRGGKGHFICAGDTTIGSGPRLAYGERRSAGRFTCTSRRSGMRCVNRRNGHGFVISRERFRLF